MQGRIGPLSFQWMLVRDTLDAASDALPVVSASSEPWDRADLLWATGYMSWMGGRPDDAAELFAELRPLAERLGHTNAAWLATAVPVCIDLTTAGDLEAAEARFSRALQRAEVTGRAVLVEASYRLVGTVQFLRGDWRSAEASLRHAVEVGNTPSLRGTATGQLTVVLACSGDTVAAVDALDGADLPSAGQPNTQGKWAALSYAVQAGVELGRVEQVGELYPLTLDKRASKTLEAVSISSPDVFESFRYVFRRLPTRATSRSVYNSSSSNSTSRSGTLENAVSFEMKPFACADIAVAA